MSEMAHFQNRFIMGHAPIVGGVHACTSKSHFSHLMIVCVLILLAQKRATECVREARTHNILVKSSCHPWWAVWLFSRRFSVLRFVPFRVSLLHFALLSNFHFYSDLILFFHVDIVKPNLHASPVGYGFCYPVNDSRPVVCHPLTLLGLRVRSVLVNDAKVFHHCVRKVCDGPSKSHWVSQFVINGTGQRGWIAFPCETIDVKLCSHRAERLESQSSVQSFSRELQLSILSLEFPHSFKIRFSKLLGHSLKFGIRLEMKFLNFRDEFWILVLSVFFYVLVSRGRWCPRKEWNTFGSARWMVAGRPWARDFPAVRWGQSASWSATELKQKRGKQGNFAAAAMFLFPRFVEAHHKSLQVLRSEMCIYSRQWTHWEMTTVPRPKCCATLWRRHNRNRLQPPSACDSTLVPNLSRASGTCCHSRRSVAESSRRASQIGARVEGWPTARLASRSAHHRRLALETKWQWDGGSSTFPGLSHTVRVDGVGRSRFDESVKPHGNPHRCRQCQAQMRRKPARVWCAGPDLQGMGCEESGWEKRHTQARQATILGGSLPSVRKMRWRLSPGKVVWFWFLNTQHSWILLQRPRARVQPCSLIWGQTQHFVRPRCATGRIWRKVVSEVEAEVEGAALGRRPLQEAFLALDQLNVEEIFKQRACVMKVVPQFLKGSWQIGSPVWHVLAGWVVWSDWS